MVRTKAGTITLKVAGAKAPRKIDNAPKKITKTKGQYSGGNRYHPQNTPEWQKRITYFFPQNGDKTTSFDAPSTSKEYLEDNAAENKEKEEREYEEQEEEEEDNVQDEDEKENRQSVA